MRTTSASFLFIAVSTTQVERAYDCIRRAAKNGHLETVAWLSSSREWNPSTRFRDRWAAATTAAMDDAAAGGHLKVGLGCFCACLQKKSTGCV